MVLIDGTTVGRGDDQLGAVLMKSFLYTLKEIEPRPWRLIFMNAGVKLAAEGSELLGVLSELERPWRRDPFLRNLPRLFQIEREACCRQGHEHV